MKGNEITEKLKELNATDKVICTDTELEEYINYGILIPSGKNYITRTGNKIVVDVIKSKNYRFTIDMSNLIAYCEEIALKEKIKRIYCMSETTYNKYKEQGLIINKSDVDYYRLYEGELWRVVRI